MTLVTLTVRRVKPGAYDAFRAAWDPDLATVAKLGWKRIYHARDVSDPDVVISFGLFDGTVEQLRSAQAAHGRPTQQDAVAAHIDEVLLDASYDVIEELVL
jgi:hypothetical protein